MVQIPNSLPVTDMRFATQLSSLSIAAAALIAFGYVAVAENARPDEASAATATSHDVQFARDVRPILSDRCFHCHGPDAESRQADLRLDTKEGILRSADGVTIVAPGKPSESELMRRIAADDPDERMPPPESHLKLSKEEIALVRAWIEQGAEWQGHWAYEKVARPAPPEIDDPTARSWVRGPIDRFVVDRLLREKKAFSPQADKENLLRRVTFDLTGMAPTIEELDAFLADDSPEAYERVVDRLLASPRFGERMAWEWLDAARYADSNGFQRDADRTMWPWRDWAIDAINRNMPFDQFTVEQIAGDMLPNATREQKLATAFCRNHMINGEGGRIAEENRVEYVFDQLETVGTVWLGQTFLCCRCHDHKFDPIAQRDYYQFFAFFNNTPVTGAGNDGDIAPAMRAPTEMQSRRLDELKQGIAQLAQSLDRIEDSLLADGLDIPGENGPGENGPGDKKQNDAAKKIRKTLDGPTAARKLNQWQEISKVFKSTEPEYVASVDRMVDLMSQREKIAGSLPSVMIMQESDKPREAFILDTGAYNKRLDPVSADVPGALPPLPADVAKNRLALARWLVDPSHPLTSRVTVNRFWQTFFGTGLVKTVDDFGVQGERPSHPELLDYLAYEFMAGGWNVKALCREIVTSATYRQSARSTPETIADDPVNRLLARGPRGRMPSWMIRDHALASAGLLVEHVGGPPVRPYQPAGVWSEATFGKISYQQDHGDKLYRRSLYTFWRRIVGPTSLFDVSKRQACQVSATRTNTPLHALVTLNDTTYVEAARALAQRVIHSGGASADERMNLAFRLATSRRPTDAERKILVDRLELLQKHYAADRPAADKLLAVGESPRDKQIDAAEHAAYAAVCSIVLNLDETLSK
jgi:mono/diheme cytochrome c family protein